MRKYLSLIVAFLLCFMSNAVLAEETEEEDINYASGIVVEITNNQITISEFNEDEEKVNVTYYVDEESRFINSDSLKDIPVGKEVEIEYVIKDDKKIAKSITLEAEEGNDEESGEDEGSSEESEEEEE